MNDLVTLITMAVYAILIIGFFVIVSRLGKIVAATDRTVQYNRALYSIAIAQLDEANRVTCNKCNVTTTDRHYFMSILPREAARKSLRAI